MSGADPIARREKGAAPALKSSSALLETRLSVRTKPFLCSQPPEMRSDDFIPIGSVFHFSRSSPLLFHDGCYVGIECTQPWRPGVGRNKKLTQHIRHYSATLDFLLASEVADQGLPVTGALEVRRRCDTVEPQRYAPRNIWGHRECPQLPWVSPTAETADAPEFARPGVQVSPGIAGYSKSDNIHYVKFRSVSAGQINERRPVARIDR